MASLLDATVPVTNDHTGFGGRPQGHRLGIVLAAWAWIMCLLGLPSAATAAEAPGPKQNGPQTSDGGVPSLPGSGQRFNPPLLQMADVPSDPLDSRAPPGPGKRALSGSPGDSSELVEIGRGVKLPNSPEDYAVTGIGILERSNNPCELTLWGHMVDLRYATPARKLASFEIGKCAGSSVSQWIDYKQVIYDHSSSEFIRAIQVCGGHATFPLPQVVHASLAWEIKGLRVRPGQIEPSKEVTALSDLEEFVRPNCPNNHEQAYLDPGWSYWSECPKGQLLTGVEVHSSMGKSMTGLEVRCKTPVAARVPSDPVADRSGY